MKHIIFFVLILFVTPAFGQTNPKMEKAVKTFNSGEIDKGISMMEKLTVKDPSDDNWNVLIDMYYYRYEYAKKNEVSAVSAAIGESLGVKSKHVAYTSSRQCFADLIARCREAGLASQSSRASQLLRNYFVDYAPDTAVSEAAQKEFDTAEKYFSKKDFNKSKLYYEKALALQPDFYKAIIYIGDSYWYLENMDSAIYYFRKGIEMNPDLLEPRKYLVDALGFSKRDEEAVHECIEAICIYPDQSMFIKYSDLIERKGKKFDQKWMKRGSEINSIAWAETKTKDPVWSIYQDAENDIKLYCDSNGVITKSNALTTSKYLEVYCWEKMLKDSKKLPAEFAFAKEMAEKGYLDCYVFLSVFHFDLYDQYVDFVKNNRDRIKTYIEEYLVER